MTDKRRPSGFTLIEMAISLTILAVFAAAGLSIVASDLEQERLKITEERLDFIIEHVEYFVEDTTNGG